MEKRVKVNESEVKKAFPGTGMITDAKFKLLAAAVAKQKERIHKNMIRSHTVHQVKTSGLRNINRDCEVVFQLNPNWAIWKNHTGA